MTIHGIRQLFEFIGGLGMFLYGMKVMSDGLQRSAKGRMKRLLERAARTPFSGLLLGTLITAIVQSSSATTVMVVSFVDAGLLSLSQSVGIIMGANIGTTVTAWMVSMSEWGEILKPEFFAPVFLGAGAFLLLATPKKRLQNIGSILVGFGLLFIGLSFLSGSIAPYQNSPVLTWILSVLGNFPILGILAGLTVTAVIQSSSASVGILQTLAMSRTVSFRCAVFLTLGQNIGTCVTALLASVSAGKTAKQAALIHLLFNTIGASVFGVVLLLLFSAGPNWANAPISATQISIFHTIFNLGAAFLLFPFSNKLVKLSERLIK